MESARKEDSGGVERTIMHFSTLIEKLGAVDSGLAPEKMRAIGP